MRGKRRGAGEGAGDVRLIPARAGKTIHCGTTGPRAAAHPRACGENAAGTPRAAACVGSSPRVRGKYSVHGGGSRADGLIPARAGKMGWRRERRRGGWAHPRACGENALALRVASATSGSSPRVRGKSHARRMGSGLPGLIPARAGKMALRPARRSPRGAHPRACGENGAMSSMPRTSPGSSPRVRGKYGRVYRPHVGDGLIPARAGKMRTC